MSAIDRTALVLLVVLWGSGVQASDESEPNPPWLGTRPSAERAVPAGLSEAGETFLRVAGSNFVPRGSSATYSYSGGGCMQRDSNVGDSWFTYDVQIPDGAVIDSLRVYYYDFNATYDINSELWAFDGAGGITQIAEADSSGTPGYSSTDSGLFSNRVDTPSESLVVVASIQGGVGASLQLCGIRVRYRAPGPIFVDGFESGNVSAWSSSVL